MDAAVKAPVRYAGTSDAPAPGAHGDGHESAFAHTSGEAVPAPRRAPTGTTRCGNQRTCMGAGWPGAQFHLGAAFESLRDYPPFIKMMKPKG